MIFKSFCIDTLQIVFEKFWHSHFLADWQRIKKAQNPNDFVLNEWDLRDSNP